MGAQPSRERNSVPRNPSRKNNSYPFTSQNLPLNDPPHRDGNAKRSVNPKFSRISDDFSSVEQVTDALRGAGLESSNLILGIDFTKSNEWTGAKSFGRKSLHHIGDFPNPYEQAISIIGRTLSSFDDDNLIPCYGFGDATTGDRDVFCFKENNEYCYGFEDALTRYRELVPQIRLSGPTSFAPVIEMAMTIVKKHGGQYHVLVIIADGQVTRSVDTKPGSFSSQEKMTVEAIVEASNFPLSIVLVGVGDGPWDTMKQFDDNIPARQFDNFQFVNFTEIMSKNVDFYKREADFALAALMEIPLQYQATMELNLLGRVGGKCPDRSPRDPPIFSRAGKNSVGDPSRWASVPTRMRHDVSSSSAPDYDNMICPICLTNPKDMAFECGHRTCCDCGRHLNVCPICRRPISSRIKLY